MTIEQIPSERHDEIRSVYSSVEYKGGITDEDRGFLASIEGKPVGAVRLCIEDGVLVLRGMMIDPAYQRQGIGTALLKALDPAIGNRRCYCINPPHLKPFYGSIGFVEIEKKDAPSFLVERLESLDRELVIMMREKKI
jgi:GNAT superfamily N-acetyltransferase